MIRRSFIQSITAAPFLISRTHTMAAEGAMNYIDAHVHVWTSDFRKYPLEPGTTRADMDLARFLPQQLLNHARASGVNRVVLIQMSYYGADNSYMLDVIADQPEVFRGIAIIDPSAANLRETMSNLKGKGVRGFRVPIVDQAGAEALESGKLDGMFREAGPLQLAVCPLINPEYLEILGRVCSRFPQTRVVVDHLARIGTSGVIDQPRVRQLVSLAKFPEVSVKVSAFYALGQKRPPHLDLRDLIRQVYDAFGPRRLMWASDCPYQILNEPYEASIALVRDRLDFLSREDKDWLLRGTAERLFFS